MTRNAWVLGVLCFSLGTAYRLISSHRRAAASWSCCEGASHRLRLAPRSERALVDAHLIDGDEGETLWASRPPRPDLVDSPQALFPLFT